MKKYKLVFDKKFTRNYRKIGKSLQIEGDKKILRLETQARQIGKPLFNVCPNLYELYLQSYRIYYIVDDDVIRVLFLGIEHKNNQQKFLNQITKKFIEQLLMENP